MCIKTCMCVLTYAQEREGVRAWVSEHKACSGACAVWVAGEPAGSHSPPSGPRHPRQSGRDSCCAFVFRLRSAPAAARPLASCWASPKNPERSAVLPGAGRVGRRSLAGTYAGRPRGPESSRLCPRWSRPGGHRTCDLPRGCARRGRPWPRARFPPRRPGGEGGVQRASGLNRGRRAH